MLVNFIVYFGVETLVYLDESGIQRQHYRTMCRAKRGVKVYSPRPGKRVKKMNVVAGLLYNIYDKSRKKHVAVHCYDHSTTAASFEEWFEWQLLAEVPEFSLIIMDNASFHRKDRLLEIAARYNVFVLFLPPYSPEFNPIEHSWANLKTWLKSNLPRFFSLDFAVDCYFDEFCC